jgi:hypothetical protein
VEPVSLQIPRGLASTWVALTLSQASVEAAVKHARRWGAVYILLPVVVRRKPHE